ncbi:lysylphosphatidylglycerol synthase domain-containing protein [Naumannella halotolerans]|uniref:Lysylphosphatidylglycerol synthase-like protein n=1 Tax=Naumannella halotolerans TaxID=993414 RepID=A0A4R7JA12_9ACTN|nr:lysylphosphatidylglycerol synthase domain-containing protein [Naumannella halotolerans]TDT33363.1 hypothetical protein CLV29_0974 [Naumannella halotolerans]
MLNRVLAFLRSPWVRAAFLLLVLGLAGWALATRWEQFTAAVVQLPPSLVVGALVLTFVYVFCMMCAWRVLLAGMGAPTRLADITVIYGIGQLGKYLPGGVWNILAAAELGADRQIPRRTSAAAMATATVMSLVTALAVGCLTFIFAPSELLQDWGWVAWFIIPFSICLLPPVFNWLLRFAFRLARMEPPQPISWGKLGLATLLSLAGWVACGLQLFVVGVGLGIGLDLQSVITTIGVGALAWAAGLLFIPAPAGAGIREGVIEIALTGALAPGALGALWLLTRVLFVLADLGFAALGFGIDRWQRRHRRRTEPAAPTIS